MLSQITLWTALQIILGTLLSCGAEEGLNLVDEHEFCFHNKNQINSINNFKDTAISMIESKNFCPDKLYL